MIGRGILEAGQVRIALEAEHIVEHVARVGDGGGVAGHGVRPLFGASLRRSLASTMAMKRSSSSIVASMSSFCFLSSVDPAAAFLERDPALREAAVADVVEVDHLADVGEAEADPLAAQDPGQPGAVAPAVDAREALPLRRDQALILVEAQRPGGDAELLAELGDRVGSRGLARLRDNPNGARSRAMA